MEIDQDWIADMLSTLGREALVTQVVEALEAEVVFGSPLLVDFDSAVGGAHGGYCDPSDHPELIEPIAAFIREKALELVDEEIESLAFDLEIKGGKILVWRSITSPTDWPETAMRTGHLGVCWTFREEHAIAHEGSLREQEWVELRLHALVEPDAIDWAETIVLNAADRYTVGEECEIRLKDDAFVSLLSVENLETDSFVADFTKNPERLAAGERAFGGVSMIFGLGG